MAQTATEKKEITFKKAFSTFSSNDIEKAKEFYAEKLGLNVTEEEEGLRLDFEGGQQVFIYPKDDHKAAAFTVLNLTVTDIAAAVDDLKGRGLKFESYDEPMKTDEKGIYWGKKQNQGPNIAWFRDPAGNILSVIEENQEARR